MPSVQPSAAYTLAMRLWVRPVETVNSTPVPGMSTTMSEVSRNSGVSMARRRVMTSLLVRQFRHVLPAVSRPRSPPLAGP